MAAKSTSIDAVSVTLTNKKISTSKLAAALDVTDQTVRAGYCNNGHYLGMRPVKLPNGRLRWDSAELGRLLAGGAL